MKQRKSKYTNKRCADKCGRKPVKGRPTCETCKTKRWRASNPVQNAYNCLKASAKKRKIEFTLEIGWFTKFVSKSGYIENKGLQADSLTIDRKDNLIGYVPGNLQVLTRSANCSKFHNEDEVRQLAEIGLHIGEHINIPF